jgi:single-stranded-DNA-specific exonuclease
MDPVIGRLWLPRNEPPDLVALNDFAVEFQLSRLVARILASREPSLAVARDFLNTRLADLPDPFLLPDMAAAVDRLQLALVQGEKIAIHGDYDVDGITGTVLLLDGLRSMGCDQIEYHIPLRLRDGYGLSAVAMQKAADDGVTVVVSVDCGVTAHAEASLAKECGIDLIITDHHQPPDELPEAFSIINPQRSNSSFPFPNLAGVGVAFFLLVALRKKLRDSGWFKQRSEPDLRNSLDLVALGTIADLVPLKGINRTLTRHGLVLLEKGERAGVRALKVSGRSNRWLASKKLAAVWSVFRWHLA